MLVCKSFLSAGCRSFYMLLPALLAIAGCGTSPDLETSRRFQQAEEKFNKASTPEDYVQTAMLYQEILDSGFSSGSVLYNQGNAWMRAEKRGRAIASYRQAVRHLPRDPWLNANLRHALGDVSAESKKPILDYVFFWQHSISYHEKAWLVTALLGILIWFSLLSQLGWQKIVFARLSLLALILLLFAAASLGRDWYFIEHVRHGVIVATETTARKGGSDTYDTAFNQALKEGTEFIVLGEQNDWLNIQVGDSGAGWITKRDCVTY